MSPSENHYLTLFMHNLCVTYIQLVSVFIIRWRHSSSGSDLGVVEGQEQQLLFAPHLGTRLWQLVAVGERGKEGGGFVCGHTGSDASSSDGRRAAGPSTARRLHLSVGGVQLQLKQQHPMVWEGQSRFCHLRHLQALERLHAAPAVRKWSHQPLENVLPPGYVPRGPVGTVVRQSEPAVALQCLHTMSQKSQTQLVSTSNTGHWPRLQTGQIIKVWTRAIFIFRM